MASLASGILVLDSDMDTTIPTPSRPSFSQRCAASLTHPVTLFAVLVLLLNDLVFKALWSNPWTTGKLSDLAWVIFASPLLVTLLSPLAGGSVVRQRVVFLTAYVGLPALYAAFNTFQSLHDWIMGGFGLLTNGSAGSPLDVTDSLVIPFGLAVALWVWRHSGVGRANLRTRLTLIAVGVAVFATIATSEPGPEYGITDIVVDTEGTLLGNAGHGAGYSSTDGGMTWTCCGRKTKDVAFKDSNVVRTARGTFRINGRDVVLILDDDSHEVVYSVPHWNDANVWIQSKSVDLQNVGTVRRPSQEPYGMIYHEQSGNIVVAVGVQGVVVGILDGKWTPVAVSGYRLGNLSFSNKLTTLLFDPLFWLSSAAVGFSFTLLILFLSASQGENRVSGCTIATAFASAISSGLLLLTNVGFMVYDDSYMGQSYLARSLYMVLTGTTAGIFFLIACLKAPNQLERWREFSTSVVVIILLILLVFIAWLQIGIPTSLAKLSALVLAGLAVWALTKLFSQTHSESGWPSNTA